MRYLQGQHILILGLGISGLSMARWCVRCGAVVRVADTRENPPGLDVLRQLVPELDFVSGNFNPEVLLACEDITPVTRVLVSPGLMPHEDGVALVLNAAQAQNIVVQTEVDLFAEALVQLDLEVRAQEQAQIDAAQQEAAELSQLENAQEPEQQQSELLMACECDDLQTAQAQSEEEPKADAYQDTDPDDSGIVLELPPLTEVEELQEAQETQEAQDPEEAAETEDVFILRPVIKGYVPKVVAVTGTNGKTTVTSLTAKLIERAGKSVIAAGNIGTAMMDALSESLDANALPEVWVLELSSFQLDGARDFAPSAATILNLSQDHLDWHGSMRAYAQAKGHIFGKHTTRVLNRDDAQVMAFKSSQPIVQECGTTKRKRASKAVNATPPVVTFGMDAPGIAGDFGIVQDGGVPWLAQAQARHETLMDSQAVSIQLLMPVDALRIYGRHNAANALAALALAVNIGCDIGPMLFGLREYRGEPHRVESIAILNGVEYFDDSKGTNVGATAAALSGLGVDRKVVVILGGDGKGQDFSPLLPLVELYARAVVLIGRDAQVIETALQSANVPMLHAQTMDDAVRLCAQQAVSGDVVLMSPACASLDMFQNYAHRAQVFIEAVHTLAQDQGQVVGGWQ